MKATIEQMLAGHEGKTLEFKSLLASPEPFLKTVIAFANLVSDAIRPRLAPEIEIHPWRRTHLVAVRVFPNSLAPHYLRALGRDQGAFIRVGSTNRQADRVVLDEMRRMAANRCFDEEPLPDLDSEAIDFRAASELFAPLRRLTARDLAVLGLTTRHGGKAVPTVGGVLLFGRSREERFPDAYLQAGRFSASDRTHILDTADIRIHLPRLVDEALVFLRKHEAVELEIHGARHRERWPVPLVALREAIINAVVHADYAQRGAPIRLAIFDDRIEVENPGLLPFGLTVEDILKGVSKLRNRVIGRVFKELGLIEQWGSGIGRMRSACREVGLPYPRFEEIGRHFRVTLFKSPVAAPEADAVETAILDLLADGRGCTTAEVARIIGRTARTTRTRLAGLGVRGLVREVGTGPRDPRRKYYLSAKE